MSYIYLLDMYRLLDEKTESLATMRKKEIVPEQICFLEGRATATGTMKRFLVDHFHHRLPRKIQRKIPCPMAGEGQKEEDHG